MGFAFNPFTGTFDVKGAGGGGGASYIDGEVQNFSALPQTIGSPAVDSAYLVRQAEGAWLLNRKPAGIYIRTANTGVRASDWTYAGEFPDVFSDANLVVYNNTDSTKNVKFDASAIATGTTRTITVPNKNLTLDDAGDSRTPSSHAASHHSGGDDELDWSLIANTPTIGSAAGADIADFAAASHAHGNINSSGQVGSTSGLPLKTGTAGVVEAGSFGTSAGTFAEGNDSRITGAIQSTLVDAKGDLIVATAADTVARLPVGATNGHVLTVDSAEAGGMKWAAASGGGVTGAAASASDVLGVSGANITGVDANADRIVFWDDSASALKYLEAGSGLSISGTTLTATGGGVTAVGTSTADVLSVSGFDLIADDGGTIDSSDPFIKWDDVAGKLVYANPLSRTAGAFYVGAAPTTTAIGAAAVNLQSERNGATQVASGTVAIAIGGRSRASGANSVAVGWQATATATSATVLGIDAVGSGIDVVSIGNSPDATQDSAIAIGRDAQATAVRAVALGRDASATLRAQFSTASFSAVYWGGQTTTNAATILNLDGTATNRFTIGASTALAVDILLVARRSDVADKWLVARRFLGIRRDGSNNTSLIGAVQTLGTDQSAGSPTWTFALTADDTNEALQLEVTGATSETVQWRATAIYRVV